MKEWDAVELLSHSRHDWLNQIQLIKGNLTLNHIDRVNEIIEEVTLQARNESKLSNLGIPQLAGAFLTFNWQPHSFVLEFEVLGEVRDLSPAENALTKWWLQLSKLLDHSCDEALGSQNHLIVTFQLLEKARITFDFQGKLILLDDLKKFIEQSEMSHEQLAILESYITDKELVVSIEIDL